MLDRPCVQLLPFDAHRDLPTLHIWLRRPHVARWWGDPTEALAAARDQPPTQQALIAVDGRAVGYLCWQNPPSEELAVAGLKALPLDLIDVDILIGEPDFIGRGIGPQALRLLLNRLRAEGASSVGLAASVDNQRALRAYTKAGFRLFQTFEEAGQDMCYLVHEFDEENILNR